MTLVVVVDDSPIDRALVGGLLRKEADCRVTYANDGRAGLQIIRELRPDLIVTDMQMPVMNGLELVASLRDDEIQIPVILMTAKGSEDLAVEALRVGASSYVPKRSLAVQLVETVRMVLSVAKEDREQCLLMERLRSRSEMFELTNRVEECVWLSRYLQSTLARVWNLNLTSRLRIGLALDEALLNALYHGNLEISSSLKEQSDHAFYDKVAERQVEHPYRTRSISVTSQTKSDQVKFVICDQGPGFDVTKIPDPTDPENLNRPSGRGVMLMHAFMDEVQYNERGNQVTLIKSRKPAKSATIKNS